MPFLFAVFLTQLLLNAPVIRLLLDSAENVVYDFQHNGIHPFRQVQRLPVAGPQFLAALVAVVFGLHLFPDRAIRQLVAVSVQKGRHLRPAMCADDDASQ